MRKFYNRIGVLMAFFIFGFLAYMVFSAPLELIALIGSISVLYYFASEESKRPATHSLTEY